MKNILKIAPIALVAVSALASCDGGIQASNWIDGIAGKYEMGSDISAEDAQAIFAEDYLEAYEQEYSSRTEYENYYMPPSWYIADYYYMGGDRTQQHVISYYDDGVVGVTGQYRGRGWDGNTTDPGLGEESSYSYVEFLWQDESNDSLNCVYTRNESVSDAYSFYKSVSPTNWGAYDTITTKASTTDLVIDIYDSIMAEWDEMVGTYGEQYEYEQAYSGSIRQNRRGQTVVTIDFTAKIVMLPLYSCYHTWGKEYLHWYCKRGYQYQVTLTYIDKVLDEFYFDISSFYQEMYYDRNEYDETQYTFPSEDDIPYITSREGWADAMNLVEDTTQAGLVCYNLNSYTFGYETLGNSSIPSNLSEYREYAGDDLGDNYFFNISTLF